MTEKSTRGTESLACAMRSLSFFLDLVKAGGSISSSRSTVMNSSTVREEDGVFLNSDSLQAHGPTGSGSVKREGDRTPWNYRLSGIAVSAQRSLDLYRRSLAPVLSPYYQNNVSKTVISEIIRITVLSHGTHRQTP